MVVAVVSASSLGVVFEDSVWKRAGLCAATCSQVEGRLHWPVLRYWAMNAWRSSREPGKSGLSAMSRLTLGLWMGGPTVVLDRSLFEEGERSERRMGRKGSVGVAGVAGPPVGVPLAEVGEGDEGEGSEAEEEGVQG